MKRAGWLLGRGMQFIGASLILFDLITWLDGDLVGTNSFWIGAGFLVVGSFIAPKKEKKLTVEHIDISEIEFRVIYKEHAGKLWRYTSLPEVVENRDAVISATVGKPSFRQVVVEEGTPEWVTYYREKEEKKRK